MSDVISGELPVSETEQAPRFLPPAVAQDLTARIAEVLLFARARGLSEQTVAARVTTFVAPLLTERVVEVEQLRQEVEDVRFDLNRVRNAAAVQLEQTAAAMSELVVEVARLDEISGRRAEVGRRLRTELWAAMVDAERFRAVVQGECPRGVHAGWSLAAGHLYVCPCLLEELRSQAEDEVSRGAGLNEAMDPDVDDDRDGDR